MTREFKAGDMIQFDYINGHTRDINRKIGLYLGTHPIYRSDGKIVYNFKVLLLGEPVPRTCDETMMSWVRLYESR